MRYLQILLISSLLVFAQTAWTHGDADKPSHGGVVGKARELSFELLAKPNSIMVYVTDHGKPADIKGAAGEVILLNGTEKTTVKLDPSNGNAMKASGSFKTGAGTKAIVKITLAGKKTEQARFILK